MDNNKIISSDHDTIIRVETKMDAMASDIKEIKDGTTAKLTDHELRIKKIEDDVLVAKTNVSAYRVMGGVIGGAIMYLLTQVPTILKSWGIKL